MSDEPDRLDAPNQQVVRPDASGPADEGGGGSASESAADGNGAADGEPDLDSMTKDQLLEEAQSRGLDVNAAMTKGEIRTAIDQAG